MALTIDGATRATDLIEPTEVGQTGLSPDDDMHIGIKPSPSASRFQVARVDFVDDTESKDKGDIEVDGDSEPLTPNGDVDSPSFNISPNSTFGYPNSDGTHMKTFGRNTTEALPCVDHYRNLLSATCALKTRPTLAELHEEKVSCGHDQQYTV
jgi:hypothetical protein